MPIMLIDPIVITVGVVPYTNPCDEQRMLAQVDLDERTTLVEGLTSRFENGFPHD
jgi:hypothetical protein